MKLFGWKAAGRDGSRPALSRSGGGAVSVLGEWPRSYEAQVREAYLGNAIAQRAVKLVAEGAGSAPLAVSLPELEALVAARSGGQPLIETLAAYLLLHGNAYVQVLSTGLRARWPSCLRSDPNAWSSSRMRPGGRRRIDTASASR